jgi:hypothetical protein
LTKLVKTSWLLNKLTKPFIFSFPCNQIPYNFFNSLSKKNFVVILSSYYNRLYFFLFCFVFSSSLLFQFPRGG